MLLVHGRRRRCWRNVHEELITVLLLADDFSKDGSLGIDNHCSSVTCNTLHPPPPSKLPYSWTETGELMQQLWRKAAFAYGKIIKTNKVTLGPPGERRKREEEVNNVSLERGLIAPHWGCAIYLRLSGSAAVSFVTSEQTRVYVGVLGVSVFKAASCETCAVGGRRGKMTQSSPKWTSSFPFCSRTLCISGLLVYKELLHERVQFSERCSALLLSVSFRSSHYAPGASTLLFNVCVCARAHEYKVCVFQSLSGWAFWADSPLTPRGASRHASRPVRYVSAAAAKNSIFSRVFEAKGWKSALALASLFLSSDGQLSGQPLL